MDDAVRGGGTTEHTVLNTLSVTVSQEIGV